LAVETRPHITLIEVITVGIEAGVKGEGKRWELKFSESWWRLCSMGSIFLWVGIVRDGLGIDGHLQLDG
jgi:hypothetical protein